MTMMKVIGDNIGHFDDPEAIAQTVAEIGAADNARSMDKIFPDIKVWR